jgi:hypothetical protein
MRTPVLIVTEVFLQIIGKKEKLQYKKKDKQFYKDDGP